MDVLQIELLPFGNEWKRVELLTCPNMIIEAIGAFASRAINIF